MNLHDLFYLRLRLSSPNIDFRDLQAPLVSPLPFHLSLPQHGPPRRPGPAGLFSTFSSNMDLHRLFPCVYTFFSPNLNPIPIPLLPSHISPLLSYILP